MGVAVESTFPVPDLLNEPVIGGRDDSLLEEVLDLAFMGRDPGGELDRALDERDVGSTAWQPEHFAGDLFIEEFIDGCLSVRHGRRTFPIQRRFMVRVVTAPPAEIGTIKLRHGILRELQTRPEVRDRVECLHGALHHLLALFRAARSDARLNHTSFRLEILRQAQRVVGRMKDDFGSAESGLRRLAISGEQISQSRAWKLMESILDFEGNFSRLNIDVQLGADGRARHLRLNGLAENTRNDFYRRPVRRWFDLARLFWHRGKIDPQIMIDTTIYQAYLAVAPAVRSLLQVLGHLDVYLAFLGFEEQARSRNLQVCLPEIGVGRPLDLDGMFNPLLLRVVRTPTTCEVSNAGSAATTVVTGPNSGGKTRMLQAVGLCQLLGQGGFFVPARRANLPLLNGLFVSLSQNGHADQTEGRLGMELLRIKTLFETAPPRSMILFDELCSGTNPSEAAEIIAMVLDLVGRLDPVAFVTTHFLDFAADLQRNRPGNGLGFLQVEVDVDHRPTYRFIPGVATSSLAADTACRLGVTFEELQARVGGV